ncbi:TPA: hypothetical protein MIU72_27535 [Klebsiella pneumoniae]|nr:hypothetical protein [Klebsiella pneumoniae]MDU9470336.1 hypothetical protein [Klebsiella pneumoniae]NAO35745.1 hypothetical protein [Klebsiella pneumoniae]HBX1826542.1 hypothetical protein [Klebsiella pneumoniae]HBY4012029.1 hypothetical protein [Klebsiella pneumoniae]
MAERGGFEPPVELPLLRFSRPDFFYLKTYSYLFFRENTSNFTHNLFNKLAIFKTSFSHEIFDISP